MVSSAHSEKHELLFTIVYQYTRLYLSLKLVLSKPWQLFLASEYFALCPMPRRNKYISQNPAGCSLNYTTQMQNGRTQVRDQKDCVHVNHKWNRHVTVNFFALEFVIPQTRHKTFTLWIIDFVTCCGFIVHCCWVLTSKSKLS